MKYILDFNKSLLWTIEMLRANEKHFASVGNAKMAKYCNKRANYWEEML